MNKIGQNRVITRDPKEMLHSYRTMHIASAVLRICNSVGDCLDLGEFLKKLGEKLHLAHRGVTFDIIRRTTRGNYVRTTDRSIFPMDQDTIRILSDFECGCLTRETILNVGNCLYIPYEDFFLVISQKNTVTLDPGSPIPEIINAVIKKVRSSIPVSRKLISQIYTDRNTGLFNKFGLNAHIERMETIALKLNHVIVAIFIDGDGIKHINDTYGHDVGDRAITRLADHIRGIFPRQTEDIVARCGGDEFVVLYSLDLGNTNAVTILLNKMQDLEESINITVDGDERIFGCTAGISYFSGNKALGQKARNQVNQIERRFGEFQSAYSLGNAIDKADKQVNERKKTNGRSKRK